MSVRVMEPYPSYAESSVEWLGALPSQWNYLPLKYLAKFSGGGTPSRDVPAYWKGNIPWASPKDMKVLKLSATEEYLTEEGLRNSTSNLVAPGALLLVVRSGILKHTIPVAINTVPISLNQDMKALRVDEQRLTVKYLHYVVAGKNNELLFEWAKQGATVESLEQEYLGNSVFPLPTVAEQRSIANFLDHETAKIDTLIEKQQQLIKLLKEKRQAVISHAVTKGLNPDAPMKDSGVEWLGEVPEHWRVTRVKSLFRLDCRPAPVNNSMELLSLYTDIGVKPRKELEQKGNKASTTDGYWLVERGDLIVNKLLAWMGAVGYSDYNGVTSPAYDILKKRKPLEVKFYHYLFRTKIAQQEFKRWSRGIMEMRLRLYFDELGNVVTVCPPEQEQLAIVSSIERLETQYEHLQIRAGAQIALLKERRTALISAAVTGKIDVRNWQPPESSSTSSLDA